MEEEDGVLYVVENGKEFPLTPVSKRRGFFMQEGKKKDKKDKKKRSNDSDSSSDEEEDEVTMTKGSSAADFARGMQPIILEKKQVWTF